MKNHSKIVLCLCIASNVNYMPSNLKTLDVKNNLFLWSINRSVKKCEIWSNNSKKGNALNQNHCQNQFLNPNPKDVNHLYPDQNQQKEELERYH